jgi:hypothetical protein
MVYCAVEPSDPAWISICKHYPSVFIGLDIAVNKVYLPDGLLAIYPEKAQNESEYVRFSEAGLSIEHPRWDAYKQEYARNISINKNIANGSLIIAKVCSSFVRVRLLNNANADTDLNELKLCNYKFLGVEYKCGSGPPLSIEIPKSHYIVGNEILSKAYILRCLEHQYPIYHNWEFNEKKYSVCIIDADLNQITITGTQHILLKEDGYVIC